MAKATFAAPSPEAGCLVEFMQGDQPQLAWVLENQSGKLRALTITRREVKLTMARVLPWTGPRLDPSASRQEMLDALNAHHARRGELQAAMDIMEVWELAQGELKTADVAWFAGLVWDAPGPDEKAAMGRALLAAKTHFKFRPPLFEIFDADTVDARLLRQAEEKARERVVSAGYELFREVFSRQGPPASEPEPDVARMLIELLRAQMAGGCDEKQARVWAACTKGLPADPLLALQLARWWGVVDWHHNHLLDQAGYAFADEDWTGEHAEAVRDIREEFARSAQQAEPDPYPYVSVDGPDTRDIDDAFFLERESTGYRLRLALARPTLAWEFQSALDQAVRHRATSLYLPEGTSHMLPEALGLELFSLAAGEPRPALVVELSLDRTGAVTDLSPRTGWVRVARNATFREMEDALDAGTDGDAFAEQALLAHELAEQLFARRLEQGASVIERPDLDITLDGAGRNTSIRISEKEPTPRASLAVSEFMILATSAMADWARERELPLLHRTQDIALPSEAQGVFSGAVDMCRVVKLLAPAILEIKPRRHAALGVGAYAPLTSPIRRYTDFVNCAQVQEYLQTGEPRFDAHDLERLAPLISSRLGSVGQVQRFRPRYWKLAWLAAEKNRTVEAVVVEDGGAYPGLALEELQINLRAPKKLLGDKVYVGQRFQLRLGRVDPLTNELKVAEALEL